jgi:class 3 adenylate cyclase/tetratricopeptide (TPR) repeat protein
MNDMREERRVVTTMFVDLVGSSAMVERLDPEDARELVGDVIERTVKAIEAFGGTVKDLAGDGVMALFGAPTAHEDDPERAVRAALRVIRDVATLDVDISRSRGEAIAVRVGIDTGEVVLGPVGASSRVEYGAVGDAVNSAARLQTHAEPQGVLVSDATRQGIEHLFRWGPARQLTVKGKSREVKAWPALHAIDGVRRRWPGGGRRTALVGRDGELAQLRAALAKTAAGTGSTVLLIGDPGVGKSRLLGEGHEIFRGQLGPRALWLEGACVSFGGSTPFLPFRNILRDWINVSAGAPDSYTRRVLNQRSAELFGETIQARSALLAHVLGISVDPSQAVVLEALTPEELHEQAIDAVVATLRQLAERGPLVVAIEDIHWADQSSVALAERLLTVARTIPMCVFLTARPDSDTAGGAFATAYITQSNTDPPPIMLAGLTRGNDDQLLHALVGRDVLPHSFERTILSATGGNPFYLQEIVRYLQEAGALIPTASGWAYDHQVPLEVPRTVERLILSRVDRLSDPSHRLICAAAAIGRRFEMTVLRALLINGDDASAALADLIRRDFVEPEGETDYAFKHALIQESVYRSILRRRRVELHGRIATALETNCEGRELEFAADLGHHFSRAEQPAKAVHYLTIAADRARRTYANTEAVALYRLALSQVAPSQTGIGELRSAVFTRLAEALGDVLRLEGDYAAATSSFREALRALEPDDDLVRSRLLLKIAADYVVQRDHEAARAAVEEAENALGTSPFGTTELWQTWIDAQIIRSEIAYYGSDVEEQARVLTGARPVLERHGSASQRAELYRQLAFAENIKSRFVVSQEALDFAKAALAATRDLNDPATTAAAEFYLGMSYLWFGELDAAEPHLDAALRFAEERGDVLLQARSLTYLAVLARMRGDVERTQALARRSEAAAKEAGLLEYTAMAQANRCWVAWRRNDEALEAHGRAALEIWEAIPLHYPFVFMALWPLMAHALSKDRIAEAVNLARRILDPLQRRPAPPVEARLRRALDAFDEGDPETATRSLAAALRRAHSFCLI